MIEMVDNGTLVLLIFSHCSALSYFLFIYTYFLPWLIHMPTVNGLTLTLTLSSSETSSIRGPFCVRQILLFRMSWHPLSLWTLHINMNKLPKNQWTNKETKPKKIKNQPQKCKISLFKVRKYFATFIYLFYVTVHSWTKIHFPTFHFTSLHFVIDYIHLVQTNYALILFY